MVWTHPREVCSCSPIHLLKLERTRRWCWHWKQLIWVSEYKCSTVAYCSFASLNIREWVMRLVQLFFLSSWHFASMPVHDYSFWNTITNALWFQWTHVIWQIMLRTCPCHNWALRPLPVVRGLQPPQSGESTGPWVGPIWNRPPLSHGCSKAARMDSCAVVL